MRYLASILLGLLLSTTFIYGEKSERLNVMLIAVDDLNDWIGVMGGHPQVKTPNMDRLAARGMLFNNAHCQSPVCNPSRASLMWSLYPETTGIYFLNPAFEKTPVAEGKIVLPQRFEQEGYFVTAVGKLFHSRENQKYFKDYGGSFGGFGPIPKKKLTNFKGHKLWDWGVNPERDEDTPDYKIAEWTQQKLAQDYNQPVFMGVGFYRPHVPQYASQNWFDLYPLESLQLPQVKQDDLTDISEYAVALTRSQHVAPKHDWVLQQDEWKPLVQSYLASVSFVDAQVGKVLDALDASSMKDNTIVVLFSDHGFHLGEKQRWAKRSIWQDGSGVPMIIAGPGIPAGQVCSKPVELIDIYPTLLELAGLESDPQLEGHSLVPLLKNPESDWPHWARSSFGPENVAIISERYRYIRYQDNSEELYDRQEDPHEWTNLVGRPHYEQVIAEHRKHLPMNYHKALGGNSTGHKAYNAAQKYID